MEANELEHEEGAAEYALGVTLTPSSKHDLLPEIRLMKSAIIDWVTKRGDSGVLIVMNIVSTTDVHDVFEDLLAKMYAQGSRFGRMLQSRTLQITLLDMEGNECSQYEVEPPDGASDSGG
jgi:hypothetical protein